MPSRNLHLRASGATLEELITQECIADPICVIPSDDIFGKAHDIDIEEWDDWMRWEGPADLESPLSDLKMSSASSTSTPEQWSNNFDAADVTFDVDDCLLDDAPFELDEPLSPLLSSQTPHKIEINSPAIRSKTPLNLRRSFRAFSSLTVAEEQDLQNIAMPYRTFSKPALATSSTPSLSPEPESRPRNKKRKSSSSSMEELTPSLCQSRKRGHNAIEKRYRTNLNDKIDCLRQGVPSLCQSPTVDGEDEDGEDIDDSKAVSKKYGKAIILTRALEYIKHLEHNTKRLGLEVLVLKTRVGAFEKLAMSGSIVLGGSSAGSSAVCEKSMRSETLQDIQADFTQIKSTKAKAAAAQSRRRSSHKSA